MRIGGFVPNATNCYNGIAFEIYVSGCKKRCKGCHNPELQDFEYGQEYSIDRLLNKLDDYRGWFDTISFLGGDLLDQPEAEEFARKVRSMHQRISICLFTGEDYENIPEWCYEVFDAIKYGPYIEELKVDGFPSSSNQGVIEIVEEESDVEEYMPCLQIY